MRNDRAFANPSNASQIAIGEEWHILTDCLTRVSRVIKGSQGNHDDHLGSNRAGVNLECCRQQRILVPPLRVRLEVYTWKMILLLFRKSRTSFNTNLKGLLLFFFFFKLSPRHTKLYWRKGKFTKT